VTTSESAAGPGDLEMVLSGLWVHPIKSCAGIAVQRSLVIETGLEFDRAWMVVDADGRFLSQRELPRMALVQPAFKHSELVLRAPGMLALHLALDRAEAPLRVRVWNDEVAAFDMGALAARWFSDFLGREVRLVRFDPEQRRVSDRRWTGDLEAEAAFADGFALLVAGSASLDEVNRRLHDQGVAPVGMERFRPNLALDGLPAHDEDHLDEIAFDTADGPVRIRLVKPCGRCSIPDVDPATGAQGSAVGEVLAAYRADPRLDGRHTFGMNAVVVEGVERMLEVGMKGRASYRFA
jgi:uncharacterized protein YcbX